jgi:hypothetical protein
LKLLSLRLRNKRPLVGKKTKRIKSLKWRPQYGPGEREAKGIMSVTRGQGLIRVLDTAIWLWGEEQDSLSIHLLVMSQHRKLLEICKNRRRVLSLAALVTDPKERSLVYDFLRHDTAAGVDFNPGVLNQGYLLDAIYTFEDLFGGTTAYMKTFRLYFGFWLRRKEAHSGDVSFDQLPKGFTLEDARSDFLLLSRAAFFEKYANAFFNQAGGDSHIESP